MGDSEKRLAWATMFIYTHHLPGHVLILRTIAEHLVLFSELKRRLARFLTFMDCIDVK